MTQALPGRIPIFPLPETVFYPHTVLPLHVFEPRYRQMVAEALPSDGVLGIVLLQPGWQECYFESPETYSVGCAGPMTDVVQLPDGRYTLSLAGRWKMEVIRYVRTEPYRIAEVRELEEREPDESLTAAQKAKTRLLGAYTTLAAELAGRPSNPFTLDSSLELSQIVNLACLHLGIEAEEKQRLLELGDVEERARRVIRMLEGEHQRVLRLRKLQGEGDGRVH